MGPAKKQARGGGTQVRTLSGGIIPRGEGVGLTLPSRRLWGSTDGQGIEDVEWVPESLLLFWLAEPRPQGVRPSPHFTRASLHALGCQAGGAQCLLYMLQPAAAIQQTQPVVHALLRVPTGLHQAHEALLQGRAWQVLKTNEGDTESCKEPI